MATLPMLSSSMMPRPIPAWCCDASRLAFLKLCRPKGESRNAMTACLSFPRGHLLKDDLTDIRRLPERAMKELERFFEATNALEHKKLKFLGWQGPSKAVAAIKKYAK
jgi:Inorganic pyrophosphatase